MASMSLNESLERAIRHVSDGWLPPQADVLEKIQQRLDAGAYHSDRNALTEDLKEDFALYMYCLRELTEMLNEQHGVEHTSVELKLTPMQILRDADLESLRSILQRSRTQISPHSLDDMNEFQAMRFRENMLSAATAEVLSESAHLDPEMGFSCGLLRQLGLTLIAWNYPRVYSRAVETLTEATTLDANLKRVLGFTPTLLGLAFARRWNLSDDVLAAMGERRGLSAPAPRSTDAGATLAKICEVGEALARANNPEHYPSALHDWELAQEEIASRIGPSGIQVIYERASTRLAEYAKHAPELTSFADSTALKEHIVDSQYAVRMMEKNQHLRHLPEALRNEIKKLYGRFKPNKILKSNIETLMKEIIPLAGFDKGAVFMYDPERRHLAPAIKLGDVAKERLRPVAVSTTLAQFDLVTSAYSLKTPLREERNDGEGQRVTVIAAALGTITPVGVLYLETAPERADGASTNDALLVFKAVRQCLTDCLNVS
ncbi:MAG: HDOD domain-containing protein [Bdellovibrionales bacterium]|nr:HDOD domain-containing protein [Bdellovibrionales bacterium]